MTQAEQIAVVNFINRIAALDPRFDTGHDLAVFTSELTKLAILAGSELVLKGGA